MEKTVLMLRDEFSTNMANLLNETKLPLYVIEPILQNFLNKNYNIKNKKKKKWLLEIEKNSYQH